MQDKQEYFSFLLRLWLAGDGDQPEWRASLEDTFSGERIGFGSLEVLCEYIKQQAGVKVGKKEEPQS
jgi:hypothetical protein